MNINWRELYAIIMALAIWGDQFKDKRILVHCDNASIIQIITKGSSKSKSIMVLVHSLVMFGMQNNFDLCLQHIPGVDNGIADALFRFNYDGFQNFAPDADPSMMPLVSFTYQQSFPPDRLLHHSTINGPKPPPFLHLNTRHHNGSPTAVYAMIINDTDHLSLPGPWNSLLQPSIHPLAGIWPLTWLCLSAHSKVIQGVQLSTCKVYGHAQYTFLQFCHYYGLLPVPADQEMLLYFATFLADARGLQHGAIVGYLYRVWVLHINMGLPDTLKGALQLYKYLQAIHILSNPKPHKLAFTYDLLVLAHPLHQFPAQQVLWAALTMAHFRLLQTGEFTVDQECFDPTCHLCIQGVSHSITTQLTLQYVTVHLKSSKTGPFGQGINMIIGCSGTQICGVCATWDLIWAHWANRASPTAPFFQLYDQPISRTIMVTHIKGLLTRLGLNPSLYSRHSLHIGGATTAAVASLRYWEIKSLGHWKNNTYQTYIREMMDMKVNCVRRMAHALASNAFNYSFPYPVKDKFQWICLAHCYLALCIPVGCSGGLVRQCIGHYGQPPRSVQSWSGDQQPLVAPMMASQATGHLLMQLAVSAFWQECIVVGGHMLQLHLVYQFSLLPEGRLLCTRDAGQPAGGIVIHWVVLRHFSHSNTSGYYCL